jgi:hypothetical protein
LREAAREARVSESRLARERAALAGITRPDARGPVFSDTPDFVAWTTGRTAVWMTREEYERLPERPTGPDDPRPARGAGEPWFAVPAHLPGGTTPRLSTR